MVPLVISRRGEDGLEVGGDTIPHPAKSPNPATGCNATGTGGYLCYTDSPPDQATMEQVKRLCRSWADWDCEESKENVCKRQRSDAPTNDGGLQSMSVSLPEPPAEDTMEVQRPQGWLPPAVRHRFDACLRQLSR